MVLRREGKYPSFYYWSASLLPFLKATNLLIKCGLYELLVGNFQQYLFSVSSKHILSIKNERPSQGVKNILRTKITQLCCLILLLSLGHSLFFIFYLFNGTLNLHLFPLIAWRSKTPCIKVTDQPLCNSSGSSRNLWVSNNVKHSYLLQSQQQLLKPALLTFGISVTTFF